jgi:hypothetical protein
MPSYRRKYADDVVSEVVALYKKGYSAGQVGRLKGIPSSTVISLLQRMDVTRRRYGRWFDFP